MATALLPALSHGFLMGFEVAIKDIAEAGDDAAELVVAHFISLRNGIMRTHSDFRMLP